MNRRPPSALTFAEVVKVIETTRGGFAAFNTIHKKLGRSPRIVERALDELVARKVVRRLADGEGVFFGLTGLVAPDGGVKPFKRGQAALTGDTPPAPAFEDIDDGDDEPVSSIDEFGERERAEAMWKERMGTQRWRDDPRALREGWHPENLRGPF